MKYEAKSVVFGRMPRKDGNEFKTAFFKIYDKPNPMSPEVMADFPAEELEFPNVEKVEITNPGLEYFLEGNDLVFDNISSIEIEENGTSLKVIVTK